MTPKQEYDFGVALTDWLRDNQGKYDADFLHCITVLAKQVGYMMGLITRVSGNNQKVLEDGLEALFPVIIECAIAALNREEPKQ